MMQPPNSSVWPCRRTKKEKQTEEDGSYQTAQVGHGDGQTKKIKTGEDGSYHTAQIGLGDRGRKKSKKLIGFNFD